MTKIVNVPLASLEANPYRNLATYPHLRAKVEALKASIAHVGLWPSIIARPIHSQPGRFEKAFGHSRQLACEELGMTTADIIVQDLTDEQMVQWMGRENGEDYGTDVQVSLNTWEAGVAYQSTISKSPTDISVARLLGWLEDDGKMNLSARTCSAAFKLIKGGYLDREDLAGIAVSAAFNVTERIVSRMEMVEKNAKKNRTTPQQQASMKRVIAAGGKTVIAKVRAGTVAARDVRHEVDVASIDQAKGTKNEMPMFHLFGKNLTDQIDRTLRTDTIAEKLHQVVGALPQITDDEDWSLVRQISFDLHELELRSVEWQEKLAGKNTDKVLRIGRAS